MFYRSKLLLFFCLSFLGANAQNSITAKNNTNKKNDRERLSKIEKKSEGNWNKSSISTSADCAIVGRSFTFFADPLVNETSYQWWFEGKMVGMGATYTIPDFQYDHVGSYQLKQLDPSGGLINNTELGLTNCIILPVSIGKLMGDRAKGIVTLSWKTFEFHNGMSFIIERSEDGERFSGIGIIDGNSITSENKYSFQDVQPLPTGYYRIKLVMPGNNGGYSDVIKMYEM